MPNQILVGTGFFLASFVAMTASGQKPLEEKFASGKVQGKYKTNESGEKDGPFTEFYENGKNRAKGIYKAGKLNGAWTAYYPSGSTLATATFVDDQIIGKYSESAANGSARLLATYKDGKPTTMKLMAGGNVLWEQDFTAESSWIPPRRLAEVQMALSTIAAMPAPPKSKDGITQEHEAGLRRLMSYRAAVGVPFDGMVLDKDFCAHAAAGAELCQAIGKLDHTPKNTVNWPREKYEFAYKGTSSSNLFMHSAAPPMSASVDMYMDDSDPSNIDRVGHRRWCINPAMLKVGIGKSPNGQYAALWAHDNSRKEIPSFDAVAYPPVGFAPISYFGAKYAWSFSPNPQKYTIPEPTAVKVKVFRKTDRSPSKTGAEVKIDYMNMQMGNFGVGPCLIFRPQLNSIDDGARYVVEIEGIRSKAGSSDKISYLVAFVAVP